MLKEINAVLAGFGGQGILFMGKMMAYSGLIDNRELSWLPSYGPEMRGGTCNCSVCLSDEPVCSPLVTAPNVLVAMNRPSYDKFVNTLVPGGILIYDSSLIDVEVERKDIEVYAVPATQLADEKGYKGMANIILLGKLLKVTEFTTMDTMKKTIEKVVPAIKQHLIPKNVEAVELGYNA